MPRIPTYRRQKLPPTGVGAAPISPRAADVAGGAVGRGIAAIGRGVGDIGRRLFQVEQEKQKMRDEVSLSDMDKDMGIWRNSNASALDRTNFESIDEVEVARNQYKDNYFKKVEELKQGKNANVAHAFTVFSNRTYDEAQADYNKRAYRKSVEVAASMYGNEIAALYLAEPIEPDRHDEWAARLAQKKETYSLFLNTHDLEFLEIEALKNSELFDKAEEVLAQSKMLTQDEIGKLKSSIRTSKKALKIQQDEELKLKQNETAKEMLLSLWDNTLTEPAIKLATASNLLTYERAKDLREALVNPKTFDLSAYSQVKASINSYKRGAINFNDALDSIIKNSRLLGNKGATLINELYAEPIKSEADWEKEAIDYIEGQILERDLLTGILYGTPVQQTKALEARLAFDVALEKAERDGKPITSRDKLILAHDIMLSYRPTQEEKRSKMPPLKLKSGLGEVPFISDSDIDKAIQRAKENLGDKATPEDIKRETLRLLGQ